MAATKENAVKKQVKKLLDELRIFYFLPVSNGMGTMGIPDIIGCFNGLFIAIECKAGKGKLTALQERAIARIKAAGGFTFVAREDNINELKGLLTWLIQEVLPSE